MIRHLTVAVLVLLLGVAVLGMAGRAWASDRAPVVYNTNATSATLTASFYAGGVAAKPDGSLITWRSANGTAGRTFTLVPGNGGQTCTVSIGGGFGGKVDVTCTYTNQDGTTATQTITVSFDEAFVDHIVISAQ